MTMTAELAAGIERAWELWADPRQLERWWGPPTYPATFVDHDLREGGTMSYYMTGPGGDRSRGWWRVLAVEAPRYLEFEDGFADDTGEPNATMPVMVIRVTLAEPESGRTRMDVETTFPSTDAMEHVLAMGMEEGMTLAMGQIDEVLVEGAPTR